MTQAVSRCVWIAICAGMIAACGGNTSQPNSEGTAAGTEVRRRVGMVSQKSNPFAKSVFENVAYGLRINSIARHRSELADRVEESLKQAALWDEVKDRLHESALAMSGGPASARPVSLNSFDPLLVCPS